MNKRREELCVAACEGLPDSMLVNLRVLAVLETSQALLSRTEELKSRAAECGRMLETVTRELLSSVEMNRKLSEALAAAEKKQ